MYIPLLSVARGHPPPHCENTQVLREAITEDDDDIPGTGFYRPKQADFMRHAIQFLIKHTNQYAYL